MLRHFEIFHKMRSLHLEGWFGPRGEFLTCHFDDPEFLSLNFRRAREKHCKGESRISFLTSGNTFWDAIFPRVPPGISNVHALNPARSAGKILRFWGSGRAKSLTKIALPGAAQTGVFATVCNIFCNIPQLSEVSAFDGGSCGDSFIATFPARIPPKKSFTKNGLRRSLGLIHHPQNPYIPTDIQGQKRWKTFVKQKKSPRNVGSIKKYL